jgi:hypothetical protein
MFLFILILEDLWTKLGIKLLFRINIFCPNFANFVEHRIHFERKFHNRGIKNYIYDRITTCLYATV